MTARYRALSPQDYVLTKLDGLSALYDRRSGATHLVASPVPELLGTMAAGDAVTAEALVTRLAVSFDLAGGEDHVAALTARLEELAALGLVERLATEDAG